MKTYRRAALESGLNYVMVHVSKIRAEYAKSKRRVRWKRSRSGKSLTFTMPANWPASNRLLGSLLLQGECVRRGELVAILSRAA